MMSGVLLWAFVVMGTFTTSWLSGGGAPLAQGVAFALVAGATVAAWVVGVRRSRTVAIPELRGPVAHYAIVLLAALTLFISVVLLATIVGKASGPRLDALIAAVLLIASALAVLEGDRMLGRTGLPRSSARRMLVLATWLGIGMVTLGACVELVAEY